MIDLNLFSDSSRDVAMASNFRAKLANKPLFGTLMFRNRLECHNSDFKILNGNISATLCAKLIRSVQNL